MRTNTLLVGFAAGIVSAAVFLSANAGPLPLRAMFFFLAPLPIYIAGLGWGWLTAVIAGAIAALAVAIATGSALGALTYGAVEAFPAVVLAYLATLHRTVVPPSGGAQTVEWYPIGRVVVAAAIVSAILSLVTIAVLAESREAMLAMLKKFAAEVANREGLSSGKPADDQTLNDIAVMLYGLLPFASAVSWMSSILANLWVAGRVTAASGRLQRPWPDIPSMSYPAITPLLLAASLLAWTFGDDIGRIGGAFSGALVFAYVLVGLAIIHYVTRGQPWRPFVLWALYVALVVLNTAASVLIALLGLAEGFSRFRRAPPSGPPGGSDQSSN